MRRSILLAGSLLVIGAVSAFAAREVSVRASQPLTPESELVAIDPIEKSDQAVTPECAQLNRLALRAEVNALGVQMAQDAELRVKVQNMQALRESVNQLNAFSFNNAQVDQLRAQYTKLLQELLQKAESSQTYASLKPQVERATQFKREQILFNRCQAADI